MTSSGVTEHSVEVQKSYESSYVMDSDVTDVAVRVAIVSFLYTIIHTYTSFTSVSLTSEKHSVVPDSFFQQFQYIC